MDGQSRYETDTSQRPSPEIRETIERSSPPTNASRPKSKTPGANCDEGSLFVSDSSYSPSPGLESSPERPDTTSTASFVPTPSDTAPRRSESSLFVPDGSYNPSFGSRESSARLETPAKTSRLKDSTTAVDRHETPTSMPDGSHSPSPGLQEHGGRLDTPANASRSTPDISRLTLQKESQSMVDGQTMPGSNNSGEGGRDQDYPTGNTAVQETDSEAAEDNMQLDAAFLEHQHDADRDIPMTSDVDGQEDDGRAQIPSPPESPEPERPARYHRIEELRRSPAHTRPCKRKRAEMDDAGHHIRLEMPLRQDFERTTPGSCLRYEMFEWDLPSPPLSPDDPSIPKHAPYPNLPDPLDNDPRHWKEMYEELQGGQDVRTPVKKSAVKKAPVKKAPRKKAPRKDNSRKRTPQKAQREAAETDGTDDQDFMVARNPPTLQGMPREVRERIFSHLLVHDEPIHVHGGWKKVYKNKTRTTHQTQRTDSNRLFRETVGPTLHPAILRVCKTFFWEGIRILYGGNRFLYRLRDKTPETAPPPVNVERLAQDDGSTAAEDSEFDGQDDADSDSDYEDDSPARRALPTRRTVRGAKAQAATGGEDVHFAKYYPLFRYIIVEAEHNRHGEDTMRLMADAIQVFNHPPKAKKDGLPIWPGRRPLKTNIRTLTIRIHPMVHGLFKEGEVTYTFVPFFAMDSPVMAAMHELLPWFIRIEVDSRYLDKSQKAARMCVDLNPVRIHKGVMQGDKDPWRDDEAMLDDRQRMADTYRRGMLNLEHEVELCCRRFSRGHMPDSTLADSFDEDEDDGFEGEF